MSKIIALVLVSAAFAFANAAETKTSTKAPKAAARTTSSTATTTSASVGSTESTAKNPIQAAGQSTWGWMKPRFSVSAYLATPTSIEGDYKAGSQRGAATLSTNAAMGLQAQLADYNKFDKWGVFTNLSWEQERSITNANLKGVGAANNIGASLNTFVLGAGLIYSINDKISIPMGLNYPVMMDTGKGKLSKFEMNPQMGMQFGAAMRFNSNYSAEVMWRKLSFSGNAGGADLSDLKVEGLNLQGRYYF